MGLGGLLVRRPAAPAPAEPAQHRVLGEFGVSEAGGWGWAAHGQYRQALGIPGAWRAAMLLSDLLGGVPWHGYRTRAGRPVELLTPNPPLLDQPAPPDTRVTTFSGLALDLIHHGNAVAVWATRNAEGWPTSMVAVPATMVGVRLARPSDPLYRPGQILYDIDGATFTPDELLHVKGPCAPGALRGMGVLERHLATLELADEQSRQARSVSQHGVPTGTLKSENDNLTRDEAREMKVEWLRSQRERTIAVLNSTTTFQPLSWNPEELQLVEARKFSLHEIALIYGLDPSWLGAAQASRTYSNIEQEAINLVKFSLGGHLARFEQALTLGFPHGTGVKAALDALLRADTLSRYQAHATGISSGFLHPDEARELEDRAPFTAEQRATLPAPPPAPAPAPPPDPESEDPT